MRLVKQTVNEDDQGARHLFFGDEEGRPGTLITCLEYPDLDEGTVGRGSTHHFALSVESEEELGGWRDYLAAQGIPVTDVMDRTYFKSHLPARPRRPHRGARDGRPGPDGRRAAGGAGPQAGLGERRAAGLSPAALLSSGQAAVSARSRVASEPAPEPGGCASHQWAARRLGSCRSVLRGQHSGQREALALGECPDLLVLRDAERDQQPPAARPSPALLAHQQVADRHAVCLPGAAEDHLSGRELARGDSTLHPSAGEAYAIRVLQRRKCCS